MYADTFNLSIHLSNLSSCLSVHGMSRASAGLERQMKKKSVRELIVLVGTNGCESR